MTSPSASSFKTIVKNVFSGLVTTTFEDVVVDGKGELSCSNITLFFGCDICCPVRGTNLLLFDCTMHAPIICETLIQVSTKEKYGRSSHITANSIHHIVFEWKPQVLKYSRCSMDEIVSPSIDVVSLQDCSVNKVIFSSKRTTELRVQNKEGKNPLVQHQNIPELL